MPSIFSQFSALISNDENCGCECIEMVSTHSLPAIQCNITGTADYMVMTSAPDPNDILWKNASTERGTINWKLLQCHALLFTGTLFWSGVITAITSITDFEKIEGRLVPPWLVPDDDSFLYGLFAGYIPILLLELLMIAVTFSLKFIAEHFIRFKTKSEIDNFVFLWHFGYRLANLIIIIVSGSIWNAIQDLSGNPKLFVQELAHGISRASQFFLNNLLIQAGSENLFELAQMQNMIVHFIMYKFITVEGKSQRQLEELQKAERFEWGDIIPPFIFTMSAGFVYW